MSLLFAVKVFGDLCLYWTAASAVGGVCGQTMTPLWPTLLCALCAGLSHGLRRTRLRLLPALLLPLCALFPGSAADWWMLPLPLAYVLFLLFLHSYDLDHGDYLEFFPRGLIAVAVVLLLSLLGLDLKQAATYGAAFVLCGVYLTRQLRLDTGSDWRDKSLNLAILLAVLAAGWAASKLTQGIFRLISMLLMTMEWFFLLLAALIEWFFSLKPAASAPMSGRGENTLPDLNLPPFSMEIVYPDHGPNRVVPVVITVLILAALAVGFWLVLRRLLSGRKVGSAVPGRQAWTEQLDAPAPRSAGLLSTDRDKVRQAYRKFLRLLRQRGADLKQADTSAQVHLKAIPLTDHVSAGQLRDLYRKARYDPAAPIGPRDARQARELLHELRQSGDSKEK